jgi:hypothetical protein
MIKRAQVKTLQEEFEFIRKTFFPEWDKAHEWSVSEPEFTASDGLGGISGAHCDSENKTIVVPKFPPSFEDRVDLRAMLIHETCHAVGCKDHGSDWQEQMLQHADRAKKLLPRSALASKLREEVRRHRIVFAKKKYPDERVYRQIFEIVNILCPGPNCTLEAAIDCVRPEYGLSRAKFLGRFKDSRRVFEQSKEYIAEFGSSHRSFRM